MMGFDKFTICMECFEDKITDDNNDDINHLRFPLDTLKYIAYPYLFDDNLLMK